MPALAPAGFAAFRWGVGDAAREGAFRGGGELGGSRRTSRDVVHTAEHLEQAPALALVFFGWAGAVAFEIYVVDKGVGALRRDGDLAVVFLNFRAFGGGRGIEHFRQGGTGAGDDEIRLQAHGGGEPFAEAAHFR